MPLFKTDTKDRYIHIFYSDYNKARERKKLENKSRDPSEKLFRGDKSYLGEKSMRVYQDEPFHTKIFIEFVALIIRNKIYTCLKDKMLTDEKKKNYLTVPRRTSSRHLTLLRRM